MTDTSPAEIETLNKRALSFQLMKLPGQPFGMHMGTSYLVNDLCKMIADLAAERDALAAQVAVLRDAAPSDVL